MKFGLVENFAFYSAYHGNLINKIIHIICIPLITWTVAVFLSYPKIKDFEVHDFTFSINGALILASLYSIYYLVLEPFSGILMTLILGSFWLTAELFVQEIKYAWSYAIGIHILAWVFQFIGHGVFEKRKPALMDSLVQAFLMAPLFVLLELMFPCGYRPNLQYQIKLKREEYQKLFD